ncbi:MAG: hypothetical protein HY735_06575 [Verrucomicrobia bacterium]|nr:hypothetical protein [Verrucomicrobiota bacterium]
MSHKFRPKADPIEQAIELALKPGAFIPDRACFSFVSALGEVAAQIANLAVSDPSRAVTLYETFLAACHAKVEELDDSSGSFGQFVGGLYCGWITARQAAGANSNDTASRLLSWMDDDDYGFCLQLEKDAAKVLDQANLAAFVAQVRARFAAGTKADRKTDGTFRDSTDYIRRRWGEVLRTLYTAQNDIAAYIALAEETGLTAGDCHVIAALLVSRRKPEEALAWVGRGIDLDKQTPHGSMAGVDLAKLQRGLLTRLGRGDEALDAAWADHCGHPSKYTYEELMKYVPKAERRTWHEKAIEAARGADVHSAMDLLLATKELDRLADLVRQTTDNALEGLSHYTTEPVAEKLEKPQPDLAARLWRAQGMRIINAKKSKYYAAALSNFERAKRCFERAGLGAEWQKTVSQVRAGHHRKSGFMFGFERLVAGTGPSDEPSFLEQAKARWSERQRRTQG